MAEQYQYGTYVPYIILHHVNIQCQRYVYFLLYYYNTNNGDRMILLMSHSGKYSISLGVSFIIVNYLKTTGNIA